MMECAPSVQKGSRMSADEHRLAAVLDTARTTVTAAVWQMAGQRFAVQLFSSWVAIPSSVTADIYASVVLHMQFHARITEDSLDI